MQVRGEGRGGTEIQAGRLLLVPGVSRETVVSEWILDLF